MFVLEPENKRRNPILISSPCMPQSPNRFEVKSLDDGIRFQGRHEEYPDPDSGIDVPRDSYADLFRALFIQSQKGLGRTSPYQLLQVLNKAEYILG
jgi:hypothetical protein